jgi:hypothetical protein
MSPATVAPASPESHASAPHGAASPLAATPGSPASKPVAHIGGGVVNVTAHVTTAAVAAPPA